MSARVSRPVAAAVGLLVAASGLTVSSRADATSAPSTRQFTIVLRSPHPAALGALARARGLSHRQRLDRLRTLVPTTRSAQTVRTTLAREGFDVTRTSTWTLSSSAPATLAASLASRANSAPLRRFVSAVVATRSTAARPAAAVAIDGPGFRNAYTAPHTKPPLPSGHRPRPTIATLQFAGFDDGDLRTYAKKAGLPDIVGTRRYRPILVDGGAGSAADSGGGDIEVALDQESILATAPYANQRPYFAPNSGSGYVDALSQVFDDVTQNSHAKRGGDRHIVALSTSWGNCEAVYGGAQVGAMQSMVKAVAAAGVTMFASSGDAGIYDCRDSSGVGLGGHRAGVDFPASSPRVVGVGGTNLQHRGPVARRNNGHNWREVAWSCHNASSCQGNGLLPILPSGTGGTGGGESGAAAGGLFGGSGFRGFAAPTYQHRYVKGPTYGHQKKRMVPDIAMDGDPQTGFRLYSSDSEVASYRDSEGLVQVGGTSLSAPVSAALLTNVLASHGRSSGIGDIHTALYKAYRKARHRVFRDIVKGTNGAAADRGHNPSVTAHKGYDTVTGLGGVLWPRLAAYLHLGHRRH